MEEILKLTSTYGFPMVVAIYLLVRLEPLIRDLKDSVECLTVVIARQSKIEAGSMKDLKEALYLESKRDS